MEPRRTKTGGDARGTVTGERRTMTGDQRRTLTGALTNMQRCTASKVPKPKPRPEPRCVTVECKEQERRDRYNRLMGCCPRGFREVLELIIRTVVLARPIHICRFIADLLDAELSRRTFDDLMYGCPLKKSLKKKPYPTDSCMILTTWVMQCTQKETDDGEFLRGIIPDYELEAPALDRYREYAGIEEFDMTPPIEEEEKGPELAEEAEPDQPDELEFPKSTCYPAERDEGVPAIDRYRDYAGIGPFEPDDVADECFDRMHDPNCKCTFCVLRAEMDRPSSCVPPGPQRDPCAKKPEVQTLYIEQPIYREPQHEKERLFRESHKSCAPSCGPFIEQDDYYVDDGLQPPDPFKENPCEADMTAESPEEDSGDDPHYEYEAQESPDLVEQDDDAPGGGDEMEARECPDPVHLDDDAEGDEAEAKECPDPVHLDDDVEGDDAEAEEHSDPEQLDDEEEEEKAALQEAAPEEAAPEEAAPEEAAPEEAATEEAAPEEEEEAGAEPTEEPKEEEQEAPVAEVKA